jgi:hypothetical protein
MLLPVFKQKESGTMWFIFTWVMAMQVVVLRLATLPKRALFFTMQ